MELGLGVKMILLLLRNILNGATRRYNLRRMTVFKTKKELNSPKSSKTKQEEEQ